MNSLEPDHTYSSLQPIHWHLSGPIPISADDLSTRSDPVVLAVDRREEFDSTLASQLLSYLSANEVKRYSTFRQTSDAELYLLSRALLRTLLSSLSKLSPRELQINTGPYGKPYVANGPEFNISHSGDLILIAIHPALALGVDVEAFPPPPDWRCIAAQILPTEACVKIKALPQQQQPLAFLQAWCHLEALLKMTGTGFQIKQNIGQETPDFRQWRMLLPHGYIGSVAMRKA